MKMRLLNWDIYKKIAPKINKLLKHEHYWLETPRHFEMLRDIYNELVDDNGECTLELSMFCTISKRSEFFELGQEIEKL